jgi:hypothetical protein
MAYREESIPETESALHRMPKKRDTESRQSRGSRHPTQGRSHALLGSVKLAVAVPLVPFEENGRERWQVGIADNIGLNAGILKRAFVI